MERNFWFNLKNSTAAEKSAAIDSPLASMWSPIIGGCLPDFLGLNLVSTGRSLVGFDKKQRIQLSLFSWAIATIYLLALIFIPVNSQQYQQSSSQMLANPPQQFSSDLFASAPSTKDDHKEKPNLEVKNNNEQLIKKSSAGSLDHVDSADLPAEFRDEDTEESTDAPKEQSRLAKLCQQTSSVLASVLPAPFGGHKRSILCQFFGQVPMIRGSHKQQLQVSLPKNPIQGPQMQSTPDNHYPSDGHGSFAVLQQPQQQPITMSLASGMHPIQLVLEQQQRQHFINSGLSQRRPMQNPSNSPQLYPQLMPPQIQPQLQPHPNQQHQEQDLKSSASILDYSYQQKLEPPTGMRTGNNKVEETTKNNKRNIKFSPSISNQQTSTSFRPMSPLPQQQVSTSGWRIFNQPSVDSTTNQPAAKLEVSSSTTSTERPIPASLSSTISSIESVDKKEKSSTKNDSLSRPSSKISSTTTLSNKTNIPDESPNILTNNTNSTDKLLVMGQPPGFRNVRSNSASKRNSSSSFIQTGRDQKQLSSIGKRSEALKSTTLGAPISGPEERSSEVRTIEVVAQINSNNSTTDSVKRSTANPPVHSTTQKPLASSSDLHQVQKREELVIASINNLTRIAFGNHLRDTVKVINKLIDQQSSLFNSASSNKGKTKFNSTSDPLVTSESKVIQDPSSTSKVASSNSSRYSGAVVNSRGESKLIAQSDKLSPEASAGKSRQKQISTDQQTIKPIKKLKKQAPIETTSYSTEQKLQTSSNLMAKDHSLPTSPKSAFKHTSQKVGRGSSLGYDELTNSTNRKPNKPSREVRRLSALSSTSNQRISRGSPTSSMIFPGQRQGTTQATDEFEPLPTVTISDIHRDKSPWQFSSAPVPTRTKYAARVSAQEQVNTASQRSMTKLKTFERNQSFSTPTSKAFKSQEVSWHLPDKGLYPSDLLSTTVSDRKTMSDVLKGWSSTRKQTIGGTNNNLMQTTPSLNGKQALALSRLDSFKTDAVNHKLDSLTALKMSLTTPSSAQLTSANKNQTSGTQSRWIPSVTIPMGTTSTTISTTTSTVPPSTSSTTTTTTKSSANDVEVSKNSEIAQDNPSGYLTYSTSKEPMSQNDLNELKASDSISRYTTHWSQADAGNEILATTRRFYQQTMPQLASAGEFFDAETIASWPEKYQAALSSTLESSKTTPSLVSETTRRSGETFESASSRTHAQTTTTARHRFTDGTLMEPQQSSSSSSPSPSSSSATSFAPTTTDSMATRSDSSPNGFSSNLLSGSLTILPANHKLTTTTLDQSASSPPPTSTVVMGSAATSNKMFDVEDEDENEQELKLSTITVPHQLANLASPGYILIDPVLNNSSYSLPHLGDAEQPDSLDTIIKSNGLGTPPSSKFPRILDDLLLSSDSADRHHLQHIPQSEGQQQANLNSTSTSANSSVLRPPYIDMPQATDDIEQQKDFDSSTSMNIFNNNSQPLQNKPYVSRKLYELLVPSTRNFVGPQNPLNQARFNLSALKFLAQNLLTLARGQNDSTSTSSEVDIQLHDQSENRQHNNNRTNSSQKLINLLSASLPASYYDVLLNESTSNVAAKNSTDESKSIMGKASSIFNDLGQLEQKKAAAILAAIRYQVPSPLVRPWDSNSDIYTVLDNNSASNLARMDSLSSVLDSSASGSNSNGGPLLAKANALARAVLLKQSLVSREELGARLRGYKRMRNLFLSPTSSTGDLKNSVEREE